MKICFVSNIFPPHVRGGYELGCQSIARALAQLGHQVDILTSASIGQLVRAAPGADLPVFEIFEPIYCYEERLDQRAGEGGYWRGNRRDAFGGINAGNVLALASHLRRAKPDVIWIFNPLGLGTIGILETAAAFPAKCLISLMDDFDGTVSHYQQTVFMEGRYRRAKSQINAVSCSQKTLLDNHKAGVYRAHRVIYNGIDFGAIPHSNSSPSASNVRFVYFGQVSEVKGLLQVIRGAGELRRCNPGLDFELDIIGRSPPDFGDRMAAEIRAQNVEKHVFIKGFMERPAVMSSLHQYDAAIMLLSDAEPFAYAVLEAAAAGLSVIMTTRPGVAECFPPGYALHVQNREDSEEVSAAMGRCAQNREWSRGIGASLRAHLYGACDFDSVVIPSYLRTIRACPVNSDRSDVHSSLANFMTARLFADA